MSHTKGKEHAHEAVLLLVFGSISDLLDEHCGRLSPLEWTLLFWLATLREVELQDTFLSGALIQESVLTETFDAITAVTINLIPLCSHIFRRG